MTRKFIACFITVVILLSLVPVHVFAAETHFENTIASANGRVYAIQRDGSLWYWGKGTFNDINGDQSPERASKTKMMDDVIGVYGDWWAAFAVKSDRSLWSIGYRGQGPGKEQPIKIMDGVKEAANSYTQWFALKTDGTVWRGNIYDDNPKPKQLMSGVKQISAGIDSLYGLKEDGSLWGWGENYSGELGVKTKTPTVITPVKIMTDVGRVYGTGMNAFAIKKDGTLWGWGDNKAGIIFTGKGDTWAFDPYSDGSQSVVTSQFTPVKLMDDVLKVDGNNHITVIKKDHSLWVWGVNDAGQLGDGSTTSRYTPQKIVDDVVDVTAKGAFTIALKSNGTLWGFGTNSVGELGTGSFDFDLHATPIQLMDNIAIPGTAASFPSNWAKEDILIASQENLLAPQLQSYYQNNITRSEFVSLIVPLIKKATGKDLDTIINEKGLPAAQPFMDTDDKDILNIAACGIINGVGDGRFDPSGLITREQAALILMNTAKFLGIESKSIENTNSSFTDNKTISKWATEAVYFCAQNNIMSGTGNNLFSPKNDYSREMSIITIVRLYRLVSS